MRALALLLEYYADDYIQDPHLSSEWRALLSDLDSDRFDDTDHIVSRAALLRVH